MILAFCLSMKAGFFFSLFLTAVLDRNEHPGEGGMWVALLQTSERALNT